MSYRGEVLVAILNDPRDLNIVRERGWYRIPVSSAHKWLRDAWPPTWLAFYQTQIFDTEAFSIRYYARVDAIHTVSRYQLFPDEPKDRRSNIRYHQIILEPLQTLPQPIHCLIRRRIIFIPTDWEKFTGAQEINDLYYGSPLEEKLWQVLKKYRIPAQREEFVVVNEQNYALDFAIYCGSGKIDVETDGDAWHANPEKSDQDNLRDNDLKTIGWTVLRFTTRQVMEETQDYCLPTITKNIQRLGGIDTGGVLPRKIDPNLPPGSYQISLFDEPE